MVIPTFGDVREAATRIAGIVRRTPTLRFDALSDAIGADVYLKCENLQVTGSFKYRGATNAVCGLISNRGGGPSAGIVCHSSGNHGAAIALAAKRGGMAAYVVVPTTVNPTKLAAIREHDATVRFCEPTVAAREAMVAEVARETGADVVHPYDDARVIAGQGTLMLELLEDRPDLDTVVACISGGGLLSGCAIAAHGVNRRIEVIGAEPALASDAAESLASGLLMPAKSTAGLTLADGLRASLSERTFTILRDHVREVITVSEAEIIDAMRLVWERAKLVIEPSAAVAVAAVSKSRDRLRGRRIGIVITGGNTSLERLPWQAS